MDQVQIQMLPTLDHSKGVAFLSETILKKTGSRVRISIESWLFDRDPWILNIGLYYKSPYKWVGFHDPIYPKQPGVFSIAHMKDDESNDCLEDHLPGLGSS